MMRCTNRAPGPIVESMTYDIPPLRRLEDIPPIRTQGDLCQFWRSLMGPLGFRRRRIWFVTLAADGQLLPGLVQVDECPSEPDAVMLGYLMDRILQLLDEDEQRHSVAFLWSRPGSAATTEADASWAKAIRAAADRAMITTWPVHLANDFDLRALTPDDLAA